MWRINSTVRGVMSLHARPWPKLNSGSTRLIPLNGRATPRGPAKAILDNLAAMRSGRARPILGNAPQADRLAKGTSNRAVVTVLETGRWAEVAPVAVRLEE